MNILRVSILIFATTALINTKINAQEKQKDTSIFKNLKFRNIGPFRGGRSVASCGVIQDPQTYYMGSTGGGVWKTEDAGISWKNISDGYFNTGSVGAIQVAESDQNVIYVGMGEHAVRGVMTSHGDGVYKSSDAGKTWKHMGLKSSRHISEIKVHPTDPNVLWVAVQGAVHGDSEERGVYKSIDGGETWVRTLFVDMSTGAVDLTIDPDNPRLLFACMWDHRRLPWQVRSGGPGSGIYRSSDSGDTWERVEGGLPKEMGKSAIDISKANPNVIYVNLEAEGSKGGVYRSNDGGVSWKQTTSDRITVARAWYYIEVFADPVDENTVYVLNAPMLKSIDGGKSFKSISNPHGDQHHMWINPNNPSNIILSNDGGACITFNGGASWSSQQNQPTIQFYRVNTDNLFPYNIYGGQQDNSSIVTPSRTSSRGITWKDWFAGPGCECAFIAFDPDDPQLLYGGCYQGNINVMQRSTKAVRDIMAYPTAGLAWTPSEMKYRFNWNAPIVASPQDPNVIYHCGNKVLKTADQGKTWEEISPDLTRNEMQKQGKGGVPYTNEGAGGEVYNTISYFRPSPHDQNVLWAGSDCGLVHLTKDGGSQWSDVTPNGLGECLINSIDVSPHDQATAYLAATKYKFNDFSPMIYMTTNFGKNWSEISSNIKDEDFVRVVREDPKVPGLLYAGTESGLYLSYDKGDNWDKIGMGFPVCPVTDLTFRDNDLVVATSGRSFWILDDLTPIQSGESFDKLAVLLSPKPTVRMLGGGRVRPGASIGQNPAAGVSIDYYLPEKLEDSIVVTLEIFDSSDNLLRTMTNQKDESFKSFPGGPSRPKMLPTKKGINRVSWDMRRDAIPGIHKVFLLGGYNGALVPPGKFKMRLTIGDISSEGEIELLPDPRIDASMEDYLFQYDKLLESERMVKDIQESVSIMRNIKEQINTISDMCEGQEDGKELISNGKNLINQIDSWEDKLIQPEQKTFQDVINFPNKLNAEITSLMSRMSGANPIISSGMLSRLEDLSASYNEVMAEKDKIVSEDFVQFNDLLRSSNVNLIKY